MIEVCHDFKKYFILKTLDCGIIFRKTQYVELRFDMQKNIKKI